MWCAPSSPRNRTCENQGWGNFPTKSPLIHGKIHPFTFHQTIAALEQISMNLVLKLCVILL